jgi:hypothetical protein
LDVFEEAYAETGAFLFQEAFELELDLESFEVPHCFHHSLIPNLIVEICQLSKHSLKNNESDNEFGPVLSVLNTDIVLYEVLALLFEDIPPFRLLLKHLSLLRNLVLLA